jgi:two-component system osmolarity sensor histidine kinase EnvZ
MWHPADSLFGRLALLFVGVLLISHVAWFALMRLERSQAQTHYAVDEATFLVEAVRQHVAHTPELPLPSRVQLVDPASSAVPANPAAESPALQHFMDDLRARMPAGTDVRTGSLAPGHPPMLWVRAPGDARWIVVPARALHSGPPINRIVPWFVLIFLAAVIAALVAAWQLQRPLYSLAQAVKCFGRGQPVPPLRERGPRELRLLTHGFNQMVQDIARTENDRAVMLAGVAHDLKTPLARLRLRAEMMDDAKLHDGVVRDVDSMAHIIEQFLAFAHDRNDSSEPVPVDEQCARIVRNYHALQNDVASTGGVPAVLQTRLGAGPEFLLPAVTLERVLSNLIDNAHTYGESPVVIATQRAANAFVLSVSDHGKGIATQDLERASRPFVRLDPARGGNGHSGLGLAIVERLVRRMGGRWEISNQEGAGLCVTMRFPFNSEQK